MSKSETATNGHAPRDERFRIGAGPRRRETERFVQGAGTYVDDMQLPGMLHAAFVRSYQAHARIRGVDVEAAKAVPGVVGVFTAQDVNPRVNPAKGSGSKLVRDLTIYPLAEGKVRHVGEAIAVVVAENRYAAQDGAAAVVVDYDPLPPVVDPEAAMEPGAPLVYEELPSGNVLEEIHFSTDNVDEVFAQADRVVSARLRSHRITACPMEARAIAASFDRATGELTVWSSTSGVHAMRGIISRWLGIGESKVRVIAPDIGGSFGGKNSYYPEDIVVTHLAHRLGRPVKWAELRTEHLATSHPGRDQAHYVEAAVRSDGRILGLRDRIVADLGAAPAVDIALTATTLYMTGGYDIQEYRVDAYGVATNKTQHGALRGIGKADASLAMERLVDIIARELDLDPADVRLNNFVPEDRFPYQTATGAMLDSGRYATALRQALELADYEGMRGEQAADNRPGVRRGIGMSFVIEPTGAARRGQGGGYGACRIRMEPSGRIAVFPSISQQGQGHITSITQIVADRMSASPESIDVFEADTATIPFGFTTGSSRTSIVLMPAVYVAANLLREKVLKIAAHRLEVAPEDLEIDGNTIRARGTSTRSTTVRDVTRIAYGDIDLLPSDLEPGLEVTGYFANPNIKYENDEKGRRNEFAAYPYDAAVAAVDVDLETGEIQIVKYVSVHDCGAVLNPRIVETQHRGCIAHGIGAAMYEELRYDEDGQLVNSTFMDYLLPTVNEIPEVILGHLETPTPFTPLGLKGAGETGMLSPPAALGNAIQDALAPLGIELRETPYTAARLRKLIKAAGVEVSDADAWARAGGSSRGENARG
ncbi:MAG: molybdopterin-dependent oxidoreductase [Chloroflexi bacterium]|nr:molybdopterin-dependent oxidoreductase [Chloroflexota bacterium]